MLNDIKGYIGVLVSITVPFIDELILVGQFAAVIAGLVLAVYSIRVKQLEKRKLEKDFKNKTKN